jgi:DNA-binding NarL/FixJ family response regulator
MRILLVDDDDDQRLVLRRLLERAGHTTVIEAGDGAQALILAAEHAPDLVVLDLAMPVRSGSEVLPELTDLLPDARIVVLSSFPSHRLAGVMRSRGAVGYVEKRTGPKRLVRELLLAAALTEGVTRSVSARLPAAPESAGEGRRLLRSVAAEEDIGLLDSAELLVSELVTNSVVHASSSPTVNIQVTASTVRVEVHDDDPTLPEIVTADSERTGGRGVFLVDQIASRWGAEPRGSGKVVWFELDRDAPG